MCAVQMLSTTSISLALDRRDVQKRNDYPHNEGMTSHCPQRLEWSADQRDLLLDEFQDTERNDGTLEPYAEFCEASVQVKFVIGT